MKQTHVASVFDTELTPKTAVYKGYEYIDDVILNKNDASCSEYVKILIDNGFKLGIPSKNKYGNFGLYVPKSSKDESV